MPSNDIPGACEPHASQLRLLFSDARNRPQLERSRALRTAGQRGSSQWAHCLSAVQDSKPSGILLPGPTACQRLSDGAASVVRKSRFYCTPHGSFRYGRTPRARARAHRRRRSSWHPRRAAGCATCPPRPPAGASTCCAAAACLTHSLPASGAAHIEHPFGFVAPTGASTCCAAATCRTQPLRASGESGKLANR